MICFFNLFIVDVLELRNELLEKLFNFYPQTMKQPDCSLVEFIL